MKNGYRWFFFIIQLLLSNSLIAQQAPVELFITDGVAIPGDEVKLDVKVNAFTDIIAFQASINWDPALLTYKSVSDFGISDFDVNDFGITAAEEGHIRFIWTPQDAMEISAPDNTILFTISFEVKSAAAPLATIGFVDIISNPAFEIEFANADYEILTVNTTAGTIHIFSNAEDLVNIVPTPNTSCDERAFNGRLSADVNGDIENYVFHWFNGGEVKTSPDYAGNIYDHIPAGQYTLQVLNTNNVIIVEMMTATVAEAQTDTPDVVTEILNIPQKSCSEDVTKFTGTIEIEVNDAQPADTYQISWWKGDAQSGEQIAAFENEYTIEQLAEGNYEVVVENISTGCISYHQSTVDIDLNTLVLTLSATKNNFCKEGGNGSVSADATGASGPDLRYYWFKKDSPTDTTKALSKGPVYAGISGGAYKCWAIDLFSDCNTEATINVVDSAIYPIPVITQRNDTLFANYSNADWFRGNSILGKSGPYLVPDKSGVYAVSVLNEFKCLSFSEDLYFGITGLEELIKEINIYPNPFTQFVRISHPEVGLDYIKVFDSRGSLIHEFFDIKEKFTDLYLSGSSNGFYLIKIKKGELILTRKVVEVLSN
jgi:hypothetical protein